MKCIYCHAEIEQDAQFCTNCGKDLSKFNKCVNCGELLDHDNVFCPYCGANQAETIESIKQSNASVEEQPPQMGGVSIQHEEAPIANESRNENVHTQQFNGTIEVERNGNRKWLLILPLIVLIVAAGAWYFFSGGLSLGEKINKSADEVEVVDSTAIETDSSINTQQDIKAMKVFLEDFYGRMDTMGQIDEMLIKKSLTPKALRILEEKGYDYLTNDEGVGGQLSSYKVTHVEDNLFEVCVVLYGLGTYWDHKVILGVVKEGDNFMIDTITKPQEDVASTTATDFIESMYKDFYEPNNLERSDKKLLSKYFTEEAMQKFYVESDYEDGGFFYCTDFLVNGAISGNASPDYGDKVVSRTIEPENDGWFLVTNIWDVIQEPVKVRLQVKSIDGAFKVVDVNVGE